MSMLDGVKKSLLPQGLQDVLPHDAQHQAAVMDSLMSAFRSRGYDRVQPPLVEFEDNLLTGPGKAMAAHTFRLMDPVSQRMMGVRADMTPQVARIAATRLVAAPRPLRLCYGGQVLRVKGSQLRPERQFAQAGVELIGSDEAGADAEVIALAVGTLQSLGVERLSVDITLPTVVRTVMESLDLDEETAAAAHVALDRRDASDVAALGGRAAEIFGALLQASGRADAALSQLDQLDLPEEAAAERERLRAVMTMLQQMLPDVMITVDPVERRGFEYQTGLSFTLFAAGVRGELGRGGRYLTGRDQEAATGFSMYLDSVLRAVPAPKPVEKLFLPYGTSAEAAHRERTAGWITVAGLSPVEDEIAEAARLKCSHILTGDDIVAVTKEDIA